MFRDRERVDCKGNTWYPVDQGWVQGLGAKRLWRLFRSSSHLFKVAVLETKEKRKEKHGGGKMLLL